MDRTELIASRAFLGTEFLTWLWYRSERDDGRFAVEGGPVRVWIDDQLSLEALMADSQEDAFKGGTPSTSPEAHMALKMGKKVSKARLRVVRGEREWTCAVKGRTLDIGGIKLPAILTKVEDDRFYERMALLEELDGLVDALYLQFLDVRLGDGWDEELGGIQAWSARPVQA